MNNTDNTAVTSHGDVQVPPGATEVRRFEAGERHVIAVLSDDECAVSVWAHQNRGGALTDDPITVVSDQPREVDDLSATQARAVAPLLLAAAPLGEQWATWAPDHRG